MRAEEPARLCLVVEGEPGNAVRDRLAAALGAAPIASLIIEPAEGLALDEATAAPLVALAQARDVAAIISGDARLARTLKADGVHVPWSKDVPDRYREARELVGLHHIAGVDAGRSRHDAMTLGEAGADYVGFGIPPHVEARDVARARRLELIAWWSEIFEVPAVAFDVETAEDAAELAAAGADFIAVRLPRGASPDDVARWLGAFAAAISAAQSAG